MGSFCIGFCCRAGRRLKLLELAKGAVEGAVGVGFVAEEFADAIGDLIGELEGGIGSGFGEEAGDDIAFPGGRGEFAENGFLERSIGVDFLAESGFEGIEEGPLGFGEHDVVRREPMLARVLGHGGFSFGGTRSGGKLSIGLISCGLGWGSHGFLIRDQDNR